MLPHRAARSLFAFFTFSYALHALTGTSVTLVASPTTSVFGTRITLTATVSPVGATGKVTFYDGVAVLGVSVLSAGQAQLQAPLPMPGTRKLKAHYAGDATYAASDSVFVPATVASFPAGGFQPAANYQSPAFPTEVVIGDFNGDGRPDLGVASNGMFSVYLGQGNGTFGVPAIYSASIDANLLAIADFNGDGKADLASTTSVNTVQILLGNGDGTFQTPQSFAAGTQPIAVAVADFDGNGSADLVIANVDNTVSILLGNGDGTLQPLRSFSVGSTPTSVAVGDFNNDGKPDVAVGNFVSNDVSLLLGIGNGNLQPAASIQAGPSVISVVAQDFNNDGNLDLAVGTSNGTIFLGGNGNGTFQLPAFSNTGVHPSTYIAGDFNGDGNLDLAVVAYGDSAVCVAFGNGDGTFQSPVEYATGLGPSFGVAAADFNGDGRADLAVPNGLDNTISILLGQAAINPIVQAVSVTPSTGAGNFQSFTFQFSDNAGAADLGVVSGSVGASGWPYETCAVSYFPQQHTVALLADNGSVSTPAPLGGANQVNSRCVLIGSGSSATVAGNSLSLTLTFGLNPSYAGGYAIWGDAVSASGSTSGWSPLGSWVVPSGNGAPHATSVLPSSGSGASQTFTFTYTDANGSTDLASVQALINTSATASSSCLVTVFPLTGQISLANNNGVGSAGTLVLGTPGTLQNSQCSIDAAASTGSFSGNTYNLQLAVTFGAIFTGAKNLYGYAATSFGALNSGYQLLGTWTATSNFSACDTNQDTNIVAADVQRIINEVLGLNSALHDLNQDGIVSVVDIQTEINAVLGLGCTAK